MNRLGQADATPLRQIPGQGTRQERGHLPLAYAAAAGPLPRAGKACMAQHLGQKGRLEIARDPAQRGIGAGRLRTGRVWRCRVGPGGAVQRGAGLRGCGRGQEGRDGWQEGHGRLLSGLSAQAS
ncbi:MAG: hypothetical protein JJU40_13875 [Rhodobacteraceae bacterium]|nr:hypothetical protein [Paracoccaceae bacterium]